MYTVRGIVMGQYRFLQNRYNGWVAGLENGSEKNLGFLGFLKNLKKPEKSKFRFLGFFIFWSWNHIKFHILIFICEFCYILQKMLWKVFSSPGEWWLSFA